MVKVDEIVHKDQIYDIYGPTDGLTSYDEAKEYEERIKKEDGLQLSDKNEERNRNPY